MTEKELGSGLRRKDESPPGPPLGKGGDAAERYRALCEHVRRIAGAPGARVPSRPGRSRRGRVRGGGG